MFLTMQQNFTGKHQNIKSPEQFAFNDSDYEDFKNYLKSRDFNYKTETEESLNELISSAKKGKIL